MQMKSSSTGCHIKSGTLLCPIPIRGGPTFFCVTLYRLVANPYCIRKQPSNSCLHDSTVMASPWDSISYIYIYMQNECCNDDFVISQFRQDPCTIIPTLTPLMQMCVWGPSSKIFVMFSLKNGPIPAVCYHYVLWKLLILGCIILVSVFIGYYKKYWELNLFVYFKNNMNLNIFTCFSKTYFAPETLVSVAATPPTPWVKKNRHRTVRWSEESGRAPRHM